VHVEQNGLGLKSPHIVGLFCLYSISFDTCLVCAGEWQQLRLAAREGLCALEGKSFSYEGEVQKENESSRKHLLEKRRSILEDITSNIRVGDIVEFFGLMNAQSQYNDKSGKDTGLEVSRSGRISEVWVSKVSMY
jgi:hypothetical protein